MTRLHQEVFDANASTRRDRRYGARDWGRYLWDRLRADGRRRSAGGGGGSASARSLPGAGPAVRRDGEASLVAQQVGLVGRHPPHREGGPPARGAQELRRPGLLRVRREAGVAEAEGPVRALLGERQA